MIPSVNLHTHTQGPEQEKMPWRAELQRPIRKTNVPEGERSFTIRSLVQTHSKAVRLSKVKGSKLLRAQGSKSFLVLSVYLKRKDKYRAIPAKNFSETGMPFENYRKIELIHFLYAPTSNGKYGHIVPEIKGIKIEWENEHCS